MKYQLAILFVFVTAIYAQDGYDYGLEEELRVEKKLYKQPYREVSVIVTNEGYFPDKISVFEGEKVRFFVTSTIDTPSCFILGEQEMFMAANKGKITEKEHIFMKPGDFQFYCPTGKISGKLTVLSKNHDKGRVIASEKVEIIQPWVPRDY